MSEQHYTEYDDSYATCVETYSTLRVFSDDIAPAEVTGILQVEPTDSFGKGDLHSHGKLWRKTNGWFYSTQKLCDSRDTRRHIDMILSALEGKEEAIASLRRQGCKFDITSYWLSTGQGGPGLMPPQMLKLGRLGLEVGWDIYFWDEGQT